MPPIVTSRQINGLLSELMTAGQFLRRLPSELDESVKAEVDAYRKRIEHLRDLLPRIHRSLLQERSRLEQERTRVQAASQWARASRQTR
jgi:predicted  nucleic acid-binding Zn-ribbon protein